MSHRKEKTQRVPMVTKEYRIANSHRPALVSLGVLG